MIAVRTTPSLIPADTLVVATSRLETGELRNPVRGKLGKWIDTAIARIGWEGGPDQTSIIPAPEWSDFQRILLVGSDATLSPIDRIRYAAATGVRNATGSTLVYVAHTTDAQANALAEGSLLGSIVTNNRKSTETPAVVTELSVVTTRTIDAHRIAVTADAVSLVRNLVAEAPNLLYPAEFAARVTESAKGAKLDVEVLGEKELAQGGFGGILGIGAGSVRPPRLVIARYAPRGATAHIALVGKGITFDSGGLSIKPAASMVGMKYDMTGAATVFAVTKAIAELGLPIAVTAWLCLAENMPSGSAIRPNDVVTIRGGKTVEVTNTDAEGRVVLADGLVAASEEKPDAIIDVATLTGAARIALGDRIAGVMGDESMIERVTTSAVSTGEEVWSMPLPSYLRPVLSSDIADIANAKVGNTAAGMLLAGVFLREFIGSGADGNTIPWAHLDIAGPAHNAGGAYGVTPKGATGTMVRTLIELIIRMAQSHNK